MGSMRWVRGVLMGLLALCAVVPAFAQAAADAAPGPASVPAARQADRVVIITMDGEIDQWTERSIKRRIAQAEQSGANAIVIEIDSPGGEVGAVLEICNAIKGSSITNTVAWVNPDAYSGGAIVALACGEIVTSSPASMGDAFPITFGPEGVRGLSPDERTKFLPPLLTEVADSARRNGYDEFIVQAMVVDDIELWSVRDSETGQLWFISESEYRVLFEGDPPRGKPVLVSVTGGRASTKAARGGARPAKNSDDKSEPDGDAAAEGDEDATPEEIANTDAPESGLTAGEGGSFTPAGPSIVDLTESASLGLTSESTRPTFRPADRGRFVDPVYIADGTGPIVLRDDQLVAFGFTTAMIESDAELEAFFGAKELVRTEPSWSERMVKMMMNPIVRGVLIVALLVGLFLEMSSPGLIVPGVVAAASLAGLLAPPMLVGMAGWWEIAAIGVGIVCLFVELLVIPGFGVFGLVGLIALFVGMVGTFIPDGTGGLFGPDEAAQRGLFNGVATVLLSTVTASVGIFFLTKHFGSIPLLNRLILDDSGPRDGEDSLLAMSRPVDDNVAPGDLGVAASTLRPSGRALVNGEMLDAIAQRGYIEDGDPVEVVERRGFSWVVRVPRAPRADDATDDSNEDGGAGDDSGGESGA